MTGGRRKKGVWIAIVLAALLLLGIGANAWMNRRVWTTEYEVRSPELPAAFDGFVIAQVSDYHNAERGPENADLFKALRDAQPDLICVTGDLIDSRRTDPEAALRFIRQALEIAPVYYVPGNHESRLADFPEIQRALEETGARVLRNEAVEIQKDGESIALMGLDDPAFFEDAGGAQEMLAEMIQGQEGYCVLLSHRPELLDAYAACGVDLALCGHAHGGQIRLPLLGGVLSPGLGLFSPLTEGMHTRGGTAMVVSRGLGNSLFPLRVNNPPELVVVRLARS